MTIRIIGAVFASLLLCGCAEWDDTLSYVGLGESDEAEQPAPTPAVAEVPAPSVQASTVDDLCRQIGKAAGESAAGEGFDLATQQQRAETTYRQCIAPARTASH
jgi:hypothetical protein